MYTRIEHRHLDAATRPLVLLTSCLALVGAARGDDDTNSTTVPLPVYSLEFSPHGKWLAAVGGTADAGGHLIVWSTGNWQPRTELREEESMNALSFSPDGNRLAVDGPESTVVVIRIPEFEEIARWSTAQTGVRSACWLPDADKLVTGGRDGSIRVWDVALQEPLLAVNIHEQRNSNADGSIDNLAVTPDGRFLASGGWRETTRLWDLQNGQLRHVFWSTDFLVYGVAFSPDGKHFASAARQRAELWVRETDTGLVRAKVKCGCEDVAFHPTRDLVAVAGRGAAAQVFRLNLTLPDDALLERIKGLIAQFEDDDVRVRDAASAAIRKIGLPAEPLLFEAIQAPDPETRIRARQLWNEVRSPEPVSEPGGHPDEVSEVCFSPDGKLLATGCRGGVVKVWNVDDWSEAAVLREFAPASP